MKTENEKTENALIAMAFGGTLVQEEPKTGNALFRHMLSTCGPTDTRERVFHEYTPPLEVFTGSTAFRYSQISTPRQTVTSCVEESPESKLTVAHIEKMAAQMDSLFAKTIGNSPLAPEANTQKTLKYDELVAYLDSLARQWPPSRAKDPVAYYFPKISE
jgi:hypothetical protein